MMTLLIFLVVLSLLVLVHECGHFFLARLFKVRVDEFGFGFPPRLFGMKRGGTEYTINLIPLGGFVRLAGEQGEERGSQTFAGKPIWQRLIILAGGVGMNVVLAWFLFTVGGMIGMPRAIDDIPPGALVRDQAVTIVEVLPGGPAANAGIAPGDAVVTVDGQAVESVEGVQQVLRSGGPRPVTFVMKRGTETRDVAVDARLLEETGSVGIGVALVETGVVSYPWYVAPWRGAEMTWYSLRAIVEAFAGMISQFVTGGGVTADVAGPVGIAVTTGRVAKLGFVYLLQFTALLSLNLAIVNILPFPALDGGRAMFVLVEVFRRKPLKSHIEGWIHQAGFLILIGLVILVTVADVRRFGGALWSGMASMFGG